MTLPSPAPLAFLNLGFAELVVFGVVALLVFGEKLPDAMRSFARLYVKVRRGFHEASRPVREEIAKIEREASRQAVRPIPPPKSNVQVARVPYPAGGEQPVSPPSSAPLPPSPPGAPGAPPPAAPAPPIEEPPPV